MSAKGNILADSLFRVYDANGIILNQYERGHIRSTCDKICRAATTHHRLAEYACNGESQDWTAIYHARPGDHAAWRKVDRAREQDMARIEMETDRIEARIHTLVHGLPETTLGPLKARTGGDPRGNTVQLVLPEALKHCSTNWEQDGLEVPQR